MQSLFACIRGDVISWKINPHRTRSASRQDRVGPAQHSCGWCGEEAAGGGAWRQRLGAPDRPGQAQDIKVFWFFSSEKNMLSYTQVLR
jgi:hypothetical protein